LKIFLIEDDRNLSDSLKQYLERELYHVTTADTYAEATQKNPQLFDLIILDWNLTDGQGLDLLKSWRLKGLKTPTIFLTAKADLTDKVLSLESGASDYITKPFEPRELLARIRVQLRNPKSSGESISVGSLQVDIPLRKVIYQSREIFLSKTEFELLCFFARQPDQVFSREELLKEVWGYQSSPTTRTVDTHILQLRQKLSVDFFETVHGIGYRLKSGT
jgi:DNA-binding response OmpR family regulator